jgi:hypothetical protein
MTRQARTNDQLRQPKSLNLIEQAVNDFVEASAPLIEKMLYTKVQGKAESLLRKISDQRSDKDNKYNYPSIVQQAENRVNHNVSKMKAVASGSANRSILPTDEKLLEQVIRIEKLAKAMRDAYNLVTAAKAS